jgi:pre-mRNA-processing factor 6
MYVLREAQAKRGEDSEYDPDQFQDPDNEFGLFSSASNEEDDREAERIYDAVDEAMDSRRRARRYAFQFTICTILLTQSSREQREKEELARERSERPKIQQQFSDLKRGLSAVTDEEWETIPEVSNLSRKKKAKMDRSYAVPDSIVVGDRAKGQYENALDTAVCPASFFWCRFALTKTVGTTR